jgi:hypothetical protein
MPENDRRVGVQRTEVTLAFPVDQSNNPTIGRQKAFAFLPIDDFGFKVSNLNPSLNKQHID